MDIFFIYLMLQYHDCIIILIQILMVARDSNPIHTVLSQKVYVFEAKYVFEESVAPAAQNTIMFLDYLLA